MSMSRILAEFEYIAPRSNSDWMNDSLYTFVDAQVETLTAEVLTNWWELYPTSKAYKTLLDTLYDGPLNWSSQAWRRASDSLKLRIILCFYVPLLERVNAK